MKSKTNAVPDVVPPDAFSAGANSSGQEEGRSEPVTEVRGAYTRILLVDDHPVVRQGLVACLSGRANLVIIGEAADGLEAIRKVGELSPDLVLMDVEMPQMNGLAATESICKKFPKTKVLVVSMHNNPEYVVQAIQMGARGFALKTSPSEELIKAIEIVQRGEPFFPGQAIASAQQQPRKDPGAGPGGLFEREKEVLVHLAAGYSNRDIAELLHISVRTVESHRARLMKKLNIHTIAGLTRYALAQGYISLNPAFSMPEPADEALRFTSPTGLRI
jgi:two-component system, NarL family, nitrate/nitrite response regulator NarL